MSVLAVATLFGTSLSTKKTPQTTVRESFITFHFRTAQETVNQDSGRTQTDLNDLFQKTLTETITNDAQQVITNTFATETVFSTLPVAQPAKPTTTRLTTTQPPPAPTSTAKTTTPSPASPAPGTTSPAPSPSPSSLPATADSTSTSTQTDQTSKPPATQQLRSTTASTASRQTAQRDPIAASADPSSSSASAGVGRPPTGGDSPNAAPTPQVGMIVAGVLLGLILVAAVVLGGWWWGIGRHRRKNGGLRIAEDGNGTTWMSERKFANLADGCAGEEEKKTGGGQDETQTQIPPPAETVTGWMHGNGFGRGMTALTNKLPTRKGKKKIPRGSISDPVFVSGPRRKGSSVGLLDSPSQTNTYVSPTPDKALPNPTDPNVTPFADPFTVDSGYLLSDVHPSTTVLAGPPPPTAVLEKKKSLLRKPVPAASPPPPPRRRESMFSADSGASRGVAVDPFGLSSQCPTSSAHAIASSKRSASGSTDGEDRLSLVSTARSSMSSGFRGGSFERSPMLFSPVESSVTSPIQENQEGGRTPQGLHFALDDHPAESPAAARWNSRNRAPSITLTMATGSIYSTGESTGVETTPTTSSRLDRMSDMTRLSDMTGSTLSSRSSSELPPLFTTAETLAAVPAPPPPDHRPPPIQAGLPMRPKVASGRREDAYDGYDEPVSPKSTPL